MDLGIANAFGPDAPGAFHRFGLRPRNKAQDQHQHQTGRHQDLAFHRPTSYV